MVTPRERRAKELDDQNKGGTHFFVEPRTEIIQAGIRTPEQLLTVKRIRKTVTCPECLQENVADTVTGNFICPTCGNTIPIS